MGCHCRSWRAKELVGPQVARMEQHEQFFIVGSAVGIGKHEAFEFIFSGEPIGGTVPE